jgi:vancomycin resistance protein VanW
MTLRQELRKVLPLALRQGLAHHMRQLRDTRRGLKFDLSRVMDLAGYTVQAELTQRIMPSAMFENKLANLKNGARLLNGSRMAPGALWSFWRTVGDPNEANGFVEGRNLVNGELTAQVGGGLCQPSSLMYHLALLGGLTIAERHPHSIDIYKEEDRFTPLGADATVVWGFKDLRLTNPHPTEVVFECFVEGHTITGRIHAREALPKYDVQFVRVPLAERRVRVDVIVNGAVQSQTPYEQQQGMALAAAE